MKFSPSDVSMHKASRKGKVGSVTTTVESSGRLLLISNRLPVTAQLEGAEVKLTRSGGGLASGLAGAHANNGLWIGWPGDLPRLSGIQQASLDQSLADQNIVPVYLSRAESKGFYEDVSNEVLWPVLHYRLDQLPLHPQGWDMFVRASEAFAQAAITAYRPGDVIWVHDYHLMLVPGMIRHALPDAPIGFFLHVPFPGADIFRVVPWRKEILESLVAADLVGFHVPEYVSHFQDACRVILGAQTGPDSVSYRGRRAVVGAFPLGIDVSLWTDLALRLDVILRFEGIRRELRGRKLFVGVDRLDYTKGLLRRLMAFEILFQQDPSLAERVRLIQIVFPSREGIESYSTLRRRIDEAVGRINGKYGTTADAPIRLLSRNLPMEDTAALYQAADIMLVTPVRDGMNLVAKEFIASRPREDGVLLLSEFAGATADLEGAIVVNPYHVEEMAELMHAAIDMPAAEQRSRMRSLRASVLANDTDVWVDDFLRALDSASKQHPASGHAPAHGATVPA